MSCTCNYTEYIKVFFTRVHSATGCRESMEDDLTTKLVSVLFLMTNHRQWIRKATCMCICIVFRMCNHIVYIKVLCKPAHSATGCRDSMEHDLASSKTNISFVTTQ